MAPVPMDCGAMATGNGDFVATSTGNGESNGINENIDGTGSRVNDNCCVDLMSATAAVLAAHPPPTAVTTVAAQVL